jgi:hypothetical protein
MNIFPKTNECLKGVLRLDCIYKTSVKLFSRYEDG